MARHAISPWWSPLGGAIWLWGGFCLALLPWLTGCGGGERRLTIEEIRTRPAPAHPMPAHAADGGLSSRERFEGGPHGGAQAPPPGHGAEPEGAAGHGAEPEGAPSPYDPGPLTWTVPAGWTVAARRTMRVVTFRIEAADSTECYITVLRGAAGGRALNLNRWRTQMGRPALSVAELGALPRLPVLGQEVPLVEIRGDFTDVDGRTIPDATLLGVAVKRGQDMLFVKLTGPTPRVVAARAGFEALCRSLREGT